MRDEGVIKYECRWRQAAPPADAVLSGIIEFRQRLYGDGLIGVYPDGIGFGNISVRIEQSTRFVISASQTGHLAELDRAHFVEVAAYDIAQNWLQCAGPSRASSEALTHAMVYETFPECNAVIHVHNNAAWQRLQGQIPTSGADVPYGTVAMADEVRRLAAECQLGKQKIFVMSGHEDGILAFGSDLSEAYRLLKCHV